MNDDAAAVVRSGSTAYLMVLPDAETDYIQRTVATSGHPYEESMLRDMAQRLGPDDLVLDVGANIGNHTLFLASVVGCRVVAYEPNSRLTEPLRRSVELNGLQGVVTVREVAVGQAPGHGDFEADQPENLGAQSVALGENGTLEVVRLDDEALPGAPVMLKVDVEGMEVAALLGAERLIAEHRPTLYVECRDREAFLEIHTWAVAHGYVLCDEFNATPTFRFEPAERTSALDAAQASTARALSERYQLAEQLAESRAAHLAAAAKYRAVTQAHAAAGARLASARQEVAELDRRHQRAKARAADYKRQLRQVRSSTTFQMGLALQRAAGSWRDAVRLPVRLVRLARRRRPAPELKAARASSPAVEPAAPRPAPPELPRRTYTGPLRVLVFGSCVTRDAFELADARVVVHDYVARSSMGTALTERPVTGVDVDALSSPFQRRTVSRDLDKGLREIVQQPGWDVLVHDPIDERFHVMVGPDGEVATRSNELRATGWDAPEFRLVASGSDEHFALWEAGWVRLIDLLDSLGRRGDLRVNRVAWALTDDQGGTLTGSALADAERANAYLDRLYARMEHDLPADRFYAYSPQELVSAGEHKWGPSPFHFGDDLYVRTVAHLTEELQDQPADD